MQIVLRRFKKYRSGFTKKTRHFKRKNHFFSQTPPTGGPRSSLPSSLLDPPLASPECQPVSGCTTSGYSGEKWNPVSDVGRCLKGNHHRTTRERSAETRLTHAVREFVDESSTRDVMLCQHATAEWAVRSEWLGLLVPLRSVRTQTAPRNTHTVQEFKRTVGGLRC